MSPKGRQKLTYWFYQQEVLANLAAEKSSQDFTKLAGYGAKYGGYTIGKVGGDLGKAISKKNPLAGGLISVGSSIAGKFGEDLGTHLVAEADKNISNRVAIYLNQRINGLIRPNGQLNVDVLRNMGDTTLGQLLNGPAFIAEVGNPALLTEVQGTITIEMLQASLKDTGDLRVDVGKLDGRIKELDKGYKVLKKLQVTSLQQLKNNGAALGRVETRVENTGLLVGALVSSTLPPAQVLELVRAGALHLEVPDIITLERAATAQELRKNFDNAGSVFSSAALAMGPLGVDPEVVQATEKFGNLLIAGGAFAAAVSLGEPLSIFNTGAGLVGAMGSMFGRKSGDNTQKLLVLVLRQRRRTSSGTAFEFVFKRLIEGLLEGSRGGEGRMRP